MDSFSHPYHKASTLSKRLLEYFLFSISETRAAVCNFQKNVFRKDASRRALRAPTPSFQKITPYTTTFRTRAEQELRR
jgi:hypothetical protein